jgi:hypothetical protein
MGPGEHKSRGAGRSKGKKGARVKRIKRKKKQVRPGGAKGRS